MNSGVFDNDAISERCPFCGDAVLGIRREGFGPWQLSNPFSRGLILLEDCQNRQCGYVRVVTTLEASPESFIY